MKHKRMGGSLLDIKRILDSFTNREPRMMGEKQYRQSAILIPLVEQADGIHLLFEVRSYDMRSQPGDVCFPGGKIDETDRSAKHCAIRETTEELGISASEVEDVIPFDYIISDIGTCIYPFIGKIRSLSNMKMNKEEVAEVFTVPLTYFLEHAPAVYDITFQPVPSEDFPYELIHGGKDYDWRPRAKKEYFYQYEDKVIWGLTARIVRHFVEMMHDVMVDEEEAMK